jgi:uncharacterized protein YndB with AHSA1/START domain
MSETKTFVCDYELPKPPEKVWRALTDPKLLSAWLMENDIKPEVGHKFKFRAQPMPHWDGIVHCEVLECLPRQKLVYSWRGGTLDTRVTWTLTATASGTLLRLEHAGFTDKDKFAWEGMSKGWSGHVADRLRRVVGEL